MSPARLVLIFLGALLLLAFLQIYLERSPAIIVHDSLTATSSSVRLSATPMSGTVPLAVTFTGAADKMHLLDFGDGTTPAGFLPTRECAPPDSPVWMNWHPPAFTHIHTYTQPGTYTVTLQDACQGQASTTIVVRRSSAQPATPEQQYPNR
jgi:hypothetical protein